MIWKDHPADEGQTTRPERVFITIFVLSSIVMPLIFGELFPFTSAPMFRDAPRLYSVYEVTDDRGTRIDPRDVQLHRNYDGNPVGLGAGVTPLPTLDPFGTASSVEKVRQHVSQRIKVHHPHAKYLEIRQKVFGPIDEKRVGVVKETVFRVFPDAS